MAIRDEDLDVLPPSPISEPTEQEPLLSTDLSAGTVEPDHERNVEARVPADEITTKRLALTMCSIWVCTFCAALDSTLVATLSGPISASFNSGRSFAWIASGYVIANAAVQPLSGKLTDIYGRRAGLVFAVTFFASGTLMCGLASSDRAMIAGRVIAGIGGGCTNTISSFVASDLVPLRRRGVWQGFANIVYGTGMSLGGVYGGLISDTLGWRNAFLIQVPVIVLGGVFGALMIKIPVKASESTKSRIKRVDFLGALLLVVSLVSLLIGLNSGGNIVPWKHPLVYISIPLSMVVLGAFVYVEDRIATEPVIPVRLLAKQSVIAALLTNWFSLMSLYGLLYYAPIFFQVVRSTSASRAGALFIPQSIGMAIGSLSCGAIMRATGKYKALLLMTQLLGLSGVILILICFNRDVASWPPFVFMAMQGLCLGAMLTITLIALIAAVDHKYQAVITSASYAFRSTGASIGVTVASAVFQNMLGKQLDDRFGDEKGAADRIREIRDDPNLIRKLPRSWQSGVIDAHVDALRGVWAVVVVFAVLGLVSSLFIKQHKLHTSIGRR